MARILVVTHNFPPALGGVSNLVLNFCRAFSPEEIHVLAPWGVKTSSHGKSNAANRDEARAFDQAEAFEVTRSTYSQQSTPATAWSVLRFTMLTLWLVWRQRPKVVYFGMLYPLGIIGLILHLTGVPYVIQTHGNELLRPIGPLARTMRRRALRSAYRVIATSQWGHRRLEDMGVPSDRIAIIPPKIDASDFETTVDVEAFKAQEGLTGKRLILTVARLSPRKGQDLVLRALPDVVAQHHDAVYVIVGEGAQREHLEQEAQASGMSGHVKFTGKLAWCDVISYFHACDIFIMPSLYAEEPIGDVEGFGIVYLEANACGKPAIGSDSGGVPDAISDGETGLLVETGNVSSIQNALMRLLDDPALCERLGSQGRERVRQDFAVHTCAAQFEAAVLNPLDTLR